MSQNIRSVNDLDSLISYLSENLGWNIDLDDFDDIDDITYEFDADDLGLKEEAFAKISSLKQLRPLVDNQKWGIFLVDFDSKKFEVTALRKILSGLIPTRRNSSEHAVWDKHDLLFLCTWGDHNHVTIGAAHFEDSESGLPQIKMISCEPGVEDETQIKVFERRLEKLRWPLDPEDQEKWKADWRSAFKTSYHQTIKDSQTLVNSLSEEARNIRDRILQTMEVETEKGYVHKLFKEFKDKLIHDMSEQQFADMYAQTIVYGLFSARCMGGSDSFGISHAVEAIPNTNPFLKGLMRECLGTKSITNKLRFDELEISSIVDLLMNTQTETIVEDFNRQTGGGREDPVIHFYEEFLTEYDKSQKVQRGVFYTPQPVVNFMVRAVDDLLQSEFGIEDGLASTSTKKIKYIRDSKKKRNGVYTDVEDEMYVPAIQVLDPSTGTGTFLRQIILQIYQNFKSKHSNLSAQQLVTLWNKYVEQHLLPRLNGFELMMAPYAVAHMKLAMVLKDTGYEFKNNQRLQVYLTNTLEEPGDDQITLFSDPLAIESMNANEAKKNTGINVVIGNPPYSGESANKNSFIQSLMEDYKKEPGGILKLQERNPKWLNDDYVKFIRFAQEIISHSRSGIVAYVNPHGFILNPTFRGMRWQLLQAFDEIYILDLHGNSNRKEKCPDGSKDENVFDIQQGVSICFLIKKSNRATKCRVFHSDLFGVREFKYNFLIKTSFKDIKFTEVKLIPPENIFMPSNYSLKEKYDRGLSVNDLFKIGSVGLITARDSLNLSFTPEELAFRLEDFISIDSEIAREKYRLGKDVRDWSVDRAVKDIKEHAVKDGKIDKSKIIPVMYRVFDIRYMLYTRISRGLVCYPRNEVTDQFYNQENLGLITGRTNKSDSCDHFLATKSMVEVKCAERSTGSIIFPLYTYEKSVFTNGYERIVNLEPNRIVNLLDESNLCYCPGDNNSNLSINEEDIFDYIYAVLYSEKYRDTYSEFLKSDYPKVPKVKDSIVFKSMASIGKQLVKLHASLSVIPSNSEDLRPIETIKNPIVEKVSFKNNRVYINKDSYFPNVSKDQWDYIIGGYPVLKQWFKNRKGRKLSNTELHHFSRIISVISETISLQSKIDQINFF